MKRFLSVLLVFSTLLLCPVFMSVSAAQDKPLLSEAIGSAIDTKGISDLSRVYVKAGDMEAAGAVVEIARPYLQALITEQMSGRPAVMDQLAKRERAGKIERADRAEKGMAAGEKTTVAGPGETRKDLDRCDDLPK